MTLFQVAKNKPLTDLEILKILNTFNTVDLPELQNRENYYNGKQKILQRVYEDPSKPNNRIVTNWAERVCDSFAGYCVGKPVSYSSDDDSFDKIREVFEYNDITDADQQLFKSALIYGRGVEIYWFDPYGKIRFKSVDPKTVIPVYDNTLDQELLYCIRYWQEDLVENQSPTYVVEVYDNKVCRTYRSTMGFESLNFSDERVHNYKQVPFTIFELSSNGKGAADSIFSLQDAYNSLLSDSIDDYDAFVDAYLLLTGCTADQDDLKKMKENRVIILDNGSTAEFLTKDVSTTEIQSLLDRVEEKINQISCNVDFTNQSFGTSSGVAIRYKLIPMEARASGFLNNFRKALTRRIEIIADIIRIVSGEDLWTSSSITFTRNLPDDYSDVVTLVNGLRGLVSNETLLAQIPFVDDPLEELEKVQEEQKQSSEMFSYNFRVNEDDNNPTDEVSE